MVTGKSSDLCFILTMNCDLIIFTNEQQFSPEVFIIARSMRHLQYLTHGTDNVLILLIIKILATKEKQVVTDGK